MDTKIVLSQESLRWLLQPVAKPNEKWLKWLNTPVTKPGTKLVTLRKRKRSEMTEDDDDPRCSIRTDKPCSCQKCLDYIWHIFNTN